MGRRLQAGGGSMPDLRGTELRELEEQKGRIERRQEWVVEGPARG